MSYDVTAEFYDLLHARDYMAQTQRLLDAWFVMPVTGVLDVGAGTGLGTVALAARCDAMIHAVEPAAGMRAVLLSRLAGHGDLLPRVTVHAAPMERLGLTRVADFALCLNTMSTLDGRARPRALAAIARAVVGGGRLVVQRPCTEPGPAQVTLPTWQLGADRYGGEVTCRRLGDDQVEWRFTYRVTRAEDAAPVREATEAFRGCLVRPESFDDELRAAGFIPEATDHPDIVIAGRSRSR